MAAKIGYLLPTRERVMDGQFEAGPLLALAEKAEALGYASIWAGDSLFARARHEPLALLTAVAARTRHVELGTAVMLPALRNPVLLAHQAATIDRIAEGRLILGVGIASDVPNVHDEFDAAGVPFDKRVGRLLEGLRLCRALWSGERVDWKGRWEVRGAVMEPTPHRPGGPPIWIGGRVRAALERTAREFDGWFPTGPDAAGWGEQWRMLQDIARAVGRDPAAVTPAIYLTLALDDDAARADAKVDAFLARYYGNRPNIRQHQTCYAGPAAGAREWIAGYVAEGAQHVVLRVIGDAEEALEAMAPR
ncbi:MAG: LLM class flavin-dependent oxidoreductase [Alphaproteobacteria bacterium]